MYTNSSIDKKDECTNNWKSDIWLAIHEMHEEKTGFRTR